MEPKPESEQGERWVMGFLFELGFAANSELGDSDIWPQGAYPYPSNDTSWWPKLAIDLSASPASLSS